MGMTCCADAQREVAYLLEQCDKATHEIELLRATVRRQTMTDISRPVPLDHNRIALLADQHLRTIQPDDIQAFARAIERAHGIRNPAPGLLDWAESVRGTMEAA